MSADWSTVTVQALVALWESFLLYIPNLIMGLLLLIFGWFIAYGLGKLATEILKKIKFDNLFAKEDWHEAMQKAKINLQASAFVGSIIKWIVYIIFIWAAVGAFGLTYFSQFMSEILAYIPNVIVAALIFVVAVIFADFLSKIVVVTTEKAKFKFTSFAGKIVKWSIWIFAIFAILIQLGIAEELIITLFTGVVALIVIAGGIAFGLGGQDFARDTLKDIKNKLKE